MIIRERYLQRIRDFYHVNSLIKIIYGVRRSGKSVILTQIMDELKKEKIDDKHIIYINFENANFNFNALELNNYLKEQIKDKKNYYIFLDEIQKVPNFETAINSLRITNQCSIFITGSNSKMTFKEISSELSGRYVSFRVNPLSFKEIVELTKTKKDDYKKLLLNIFEYGSLPERFLFKNEQSIINYISDIYDSIVLRDVIDRLGVSDVNTFNKILQYLLETETREFSASNVLKYLEDNNTKIANDTFYKYIDALCSSFILNKVYRYDIKGKSMLKSLYKFYATDLGIKQIKISNKEINYSQCLENMVYNELINKGYEVFVGKTTNSEIDFIATKHKDKKYIQVSYTLSDPNTLKREINAFKDIQDNFQKYIISIDDEDYSQDGIINLNAFKFFMDDDF